MLKGVIYQTIIHNFESAKKVRASRHHLLLEKTSFMALDGVTSIVRLKDVTNKRKRMRRSLSIGGSSSVKWLKVGRSRRLQMCFRCLLCVESK